MTFADIKDPELGGGGRYDVLLDGTEDHQMLDNMTVDADGNLIIQEDPGEQAHLARIWKYYPRSDELVEIAKHDPAFFSDPPTPPSHLTIDEESSGVIEITDLLRKNSKSSDSDRFDRHDDDEFDRIEVGETWLSLLSRGSPRHTIRRATRSSSKEANSGLSECRGMFAKSRPEVQSRTHLANLRPHHTTDNR